MSRVDIGRLVRACIRGLLIIFLAGVPFAGFILLIEWAAKMAGVGSIIPNQWGEITFVKYCLCSVSILLFFIFAGKVRLFQPREKHKWLGWLIIIFWFFALRYLIRYFGYSVSILAVVTVGSFGFAYWEYLKICKEKGEGAEEGK